MDSLPRPVSAAVLAQRRSPAASAAAGWLVSAALHLVGTLALATAAGLGGPGPAAATRPARSSPARPEPRASTPPTAAFEVFLLPADTPRLPPTVGAAPMGLAPTAVPAPRPEVATAAPLLATFATRAPEPSSSLAPAAAAPSPATAALPNLRQAAAVFVERGAPKAPAIAGTIFAPPRGVIARESPPTLTASADGSYRGTDLVFEARIDAEGRMSLSDKPNLSAHLALPSASGVKRHLARWLEDPSGLAIDERSIETHTVPLVGGSFDLGDAAMRALGIDPYLARKRDYYEQTREFRSALRQASQAARLEEVPTLVTENLEVLWRAPGSPADRRRHLFALWDECADAGSAELTRAAAQARHLILEFIRARLPQGSTHAYAGAELQALNRARQSRERFEPYARPGDSAILPP